MPKHPGPLLKHNKPNMKEYIQYLSALGQGKASELITQQTPHQPRKQPTPRTKPNKQLHNQLCNKIVDHLRLHGWQAFIMPDKAGQFQGRYLKDRRRLKGIWDIVIWKHTVPYKIWIEVKIKPDSLKTDQILFGIEMVRTGDQAYLVHTISQIYTICGCEKELRELK